MNPINVGDQPSLASFFWAQRRVFALGLTLGVLRTLVLTPFPLIFRAIADDDVRRGDAVAVLVSCAGLVGLLVLHYVLSVSGHRRLSIAMSKIMMELRAAIFGRVQFISLGHLDQERAGRLLSKYAFDTQKVETIGMQILSSLIPNVVYSVSVFVVLVSMNWQLSVILLLALPFITIVRFVFFERLKHSHNQVRMAQERLTGTASEFFSALRLVRSYGEEKQVEGSLAANSSGVARAFVHANTLGSHFGTFSYVSTQTMSIVVIGGGALLAIHGGLSTGTLLAFVAGLPALLMPIQIFIQVADQYFVGRESYRSIRELLGNPNVERWHGARRLPEVRGEIEFRDVAFTYPNARRGAIHGFNLHIHAGENVALVGPSGSGKSTIASLLLGLYHPAAGQILIDGVPQDELDMRWFRRQTAIVMQDSILLSGTIAENIRFARTDATDDEVRDAARRANAEDFIRHLPDGFNTKVGERGATLSGGQRQRLSIARAILRNPPILLLDEPTSALDYESERLIQDALDRLAERRTVITIAHRLSTVRRAHRIITLQQGRIVDVGTYAELAERPGYFRDLLATHQL